VLDGEAEASRRWAELKAMAEREQRWRRWRRGCDGWAPWLTARVVVTLFPGFFIVVELDCFAGTVDCERTEKKERFDLWFFEL
jgi:hypothetical protein